ncbi:MAG: membrane protein [Candidatus Entotheonella factor]|uniref:TVP38/TMEM64 family membrane protein n=1 Tax=Entotheonella factor TaxID=1429438 RepID=W4L769_ENTF1|nr:MAG: membrane protein [Candidatus Entotheonella factor]
MAQTETQASASPSFSFKRLIPLLVLVAGLVVFFALGLHRYISFEVLRDNREALLNWVQQNGLLAALVYMGIYAVAVAFSLPGGLVLSITGGFLFGTLLGSLYIVVGATVGATALFIIAKSALGDFLRAKAGPWLQKMEEGFRENALSYLLVLRLVPLFPFFVVNLVPAFLGVPLTTYVIGTFFGIIPGVFVFASVGAGLGSIFDKGETFSAAGILTPQIMIALIGLAVLALIPVVYKKMKARSA